jgi:hypothetical protein
MWVNIGQYIGSRTTKSTVLRKGNYMYRHVYRFIVQPHVSISSLNTLRRVVNPAERLICTHNPSVLMHETIPGPLDGIS